MPTIKNRRATLAQWETENPILAAGEIGVALDVDVLKVGNGLSPWSDLKSYITKADFDDVYAPLSVVNDLALKLTKADADLRYSPLGRVTSSGKELSAATRLSQFSWSGGDWVNVHGLEMQVTTEMGPAYLYTNLRMCILETVDDCFVEYRILDTENQIALTYNSLTVLGLAGGYNSSLLTLISGRIPNGTLDRKYIVQVKVTGTYQVAYIVPDWLPGASAELYAIGA